MNYTIAELNELGVYPRPATVGFIDDSVRSQLRMGMDAAPITDANIGIPPWMNLWHDPKVIDVILAPRRAEEIADPVRKGDWTTDTAMFNFVERSGFVEGYGDYSRGGQSDFNAKFPTRESWHGEIMTTWGDKEVARWGNAKLDFHAQKEMAAATTISIMHNKIWFRGVAGRKCYGLITDPNLPTPIVPTVGAAGNTWELKTAEEIYADFEAMYQQLAIQGMGHLTMDDEIIVVMSNRVNAYLMKRTLYGSIPVKTLIQDSFPKMKFVVAPEYTTASGELVQMIVTKVDGNPTMLMGYTELERSHGIRRDVSWWEEKKSFGSWGCIIFYPFAIAQMLGV